MNLIVRFYWQHDLDLIGLAACPDFSMGKWLKRAVISYARGEPLSIPIKRRLSLPTRMRISS